MAITYAHLLPTRPEQTLVKILKNERMYNGIDTILFFDKEKLQDQEPIALIDQHQMQQLMLQTRSTLYGSTIPTGFFRAVEAQTPEEKIKAIIDLVNGQIINKNGVSQEEQTHLHNKYGSSNRFMHTLESHQGQCFDKAVIMTALARGSGLETRIASYHEVTQEDWKAVTTKVKEASSRVSYQGRTYPSEELLFFLQHKYPSLSSNPTMFNQMIQSYSEPITLDADNQIARRAYAGHFWAEFKVEDQWTENNTVFTGYESAYFNTVFEIASKRKQVVPEFSIKEPLGLSEWFLL